jgi:hypothetical protein
MAATLTENSPEGGAPITAFFYISRRIEIGGTGNQ